MKNLPARGVHDQEGEDGKSLGPSATQEDEVRVTFPLLEGKSSDRLRNNIDTVSLPLFSFAILIHLS